MKKTLYAGFILSLAILTLSSVAHSSETKPKIVTTIHPLGLIAAEILGSDEDITVLIDQGSSPHNYQLKPSHVMALNKADLVIWVGNSLEMFMQKPVTQLSNKESVLTLEKLPGLKLHKYRSNALWLTDTHEKAGHDHDHGHDHQHSSDSDGHIWLSTDNVAIIAQNIEKKLSAIAPEKQATYQRNLATFEEKLSQLNQSIKASLLPYKNTPYLVYHDAFQYFESEYQLNSLGTFTTDNSQSLSAKRLRTINAIIKTHNIKCIFSDQQYDPSLPNKIAAQSDARVVKLDPLGGGLSVGNGGYLRLLETISKNMLSCFSEHLTHN